MSGTLDAERFLALVDAYRRARLLFRDGAWANRLAHLYVAYHFDGASG